MMTRRIPFCLVALIFFWTPLFSQSNDYYVVIGGFAIEANAIKFRDRALQLNIPSTYSFNGEHKLFYVFVRNTENKGDAYATLASMQEEGFKDAWVYKGQLSGSIAFGKPTSIDPPVQTVSFQQTEDTSKQQIEELPERENEKPSDSSVEKDTASVGQVSSEITTITDAAPSKPAGKPFVFKIINSATGNPVTGQVHLLETEKSNQYRGVNSNEQVYVIPPKNRNGRWYIACHVIGFQPLKRSFIYSNPQQLPGASLGSGDEVIIPLALERVKKGDYIEMDNVKFFGNSSIFTPGSERELSELVAMMEENPAYKIRLHGHTNGDPEGEIISMGESQNFFALEDADKRSEPSAKALSTYRAESVRDYLVSKGIEASRISVKGEGGKQPIFDPKGANAAGNDRVEVEITKN